MISIKENCSNTLVIKKSKFICFLYRVDSIDEVNNYLFFLNNEFSDSTHICYAYILDNIKRFNDDGEPSSTAGMPILNVLESKNLNHVLCCVVRYFGGIKLGANGLVRAYSDSASLVINSSKFVELTKGFIYSISFLYDNTKIIDNILKDYCIIDKSYGEDVCYKFKSDIMLDELNKYGNLGIVENCYIEKDL